MSYYGLKDGSFLNKKFNIFLDSGAFSAFNLKAKIELSEYIDFIKKNEDKIEVYANLDVIGNAEATYENQKIMEKAGLKPIPTFHQGEDFKWLKRYIEEGHDYIALGGLVGIERKKLIPWLNKCFDIIPKGKKIHGFGMTAPLLIDIFPFYSVDSSSWISGEKYGNFYIFSRGNIKQLNTSKKARRGNKEDYENLKNWNIIQWKLYANYLEDKYGNQRNTN